MSVRIEENTLHIFNPSSGEDIQSIGISTKDEIEDVFSEELFQILSKIDKDQIPEKYIGFYQYKTSKVNENIKKIK